jgi:hypothetical protein
MCFLTGGIFQIILGLLGKCGFWGLFTILTDVNGKGRWPHLHQIDTAACKTLHEINSSPF